jgi:hypothetical protein
MCGLWTWIVEGFVCVGICLLSAEAIHLVQVDSFSIISLIYVKCGNTDSSSFVVLSLLRQTFDGSRSSRI